MRIKIVSVTRCGWVKKKGKYSFRFKFLSIKSFDLYFRVNRSLAITKSIEVSSMTIDFKALSSVWASSSVISDKWSAKLVFILSLVLLSSTHESFVARSTLFRASRTVFKRLFNQPPSPSNNNSWNHFKILFRTWKCGYVHCLHTVPSDLLLLNLRRGKIFTVALAVDIFWKLVGLEPKLSNMKSTTIRTSCCRRLTSIGGALSWLRNNCSWAKMSFLLIFLK